MKSCKKYDNWCQEEKRSCKGCFYNRKKVNKMYEVTYSISGVIKTIDINADDAITAQALFTNMFGGGAVEIINIVRK